MLGFWLVYTLIAAPCIFYTGYALTAHAACPLWLTIFIYVSLSVAWFAMMLIWNLRANPKISARTYGIVSNIGYSMLGFAFLLLCALGLRDTVWLTVYLLYPFKIASPFESLALSAANLWTVGAVAVLGLSAIFLARRKPHVIYYRFEDRRIKQPLKILALSDWHINKAIAPEKVRRLVRYFNELHPDAVIMAGDIADDLAQDVKTHLKELKKLYAPYGIFVTLGNHEIYNDALQWEQTYAALGWQVLHNSGVLLEDTGVYIGGVPSTAGFRPNPEQAMRRAGENSFNLLLAHEPSVAHYLDAAPVDVQFSGHTHGGQIFPFHFPVKWGNTGFVSGAYNLGKTMLLVSNGAGYWGPPMRLFAPSDVLLMELNPQPHNF